MTDTIETTFAELLDFKFPGEITYNPDGNRGNLFIGELPDKPDNSVAVTLYGGMIDWEHPFSEPRIQVRLRGRPQEGSVPSSRLAWRIVNAMHNITVSGVEEKVRRRLGRIKQCMALSTPNYMGLDSANRAEWSVNFKLLVKGDTNE